MFNPRQPREAIQKHAGATCTPHNPHDADGKVVEHRDVPQRAPATSANDKTMF